MFVARNAGRLGIARGNKGSNIVGSSLGHRLGRKLVFFPMFLGRVAVALDMNYCGLMSGVSQMTSSSK